MKNRFARTLLSSTFSILPMIITIVVLSVIPTSNIEGGVRLNIVTLVPGDYVALAICAICLILGLAIFTIGTDQSLSKVGEYMGASLSKQSKLFVVIIFSFLLGALITCAEPSILIIASQVQINTLVLIGSIAGGVGIFVVIGVLRVIFHKSLKIWYIIFYFIVFALISIIAVDEQTKQFLPFIFDAGGITTGAATVPFILALGAGIAAVRGGKASKENSFGLVGMASIGPILTMALLILINRSGFSDYVIKSFDHFHNAGDIFAALALAFIPQSSTSLGSLVEVALAILPIMIIFFIYERIYIKLPKNKRIELLYGFWLAYIGLVIFLAGINSIMTPFGNRVGENLGRLPNNGYIILISFIIGVVSILCEPAVHVLTKSINITSDGYIKKSTVLIALALGVGLAIALATIRSLYNFNILYIVVPGYVISLLMMFITPNLFTAMGFDAGGTASGPLSVSFVLPMIIGLTYAKNPDYTQSSIKYYTQSFGVVALIALTPIITIQFLGVYMQFKKIRQLQVSANMPYDPKDAEIIHF